MFLFKRFHLTILKWTIPVFLAIFLLSLLSILHEHNIKCISFCSLWKFNLLCVILQIPSTNDCVPLILLTSLISPNQLSSYPTREDKSFTLLHCWTTQLIQYVPIHDKSPVTSWQCFEMHIFNTDLLLAKLQDRTPLLTVQTASKLYLSSTDTLTFRKINWLNMSFHTHHIVQCIPITSKGR